MHGVRQTGAVVLVGAGLLLGTSIAGQQNGAVPAAPPVFERVCGNCHDGIRIVQGRRLKSQWEEVIDKMAIEGAKGTDEEFAAVLDFLLSEFGRVNINSAPAAEIAKIIHLSPDAADRIVGYRKEHGKFADFEALIGVPGAPVEALRLRRDALVF